MAQQIEIANFNMDLSGVLDETAAYRKELDKLKAQLKEMKKSEDTASAALVDQETKIKSVNEEYQKRLKVLQDSRDSNQQAIKRNDMLNAALEKQSNSLRELRANNAALNKLKVDAPLGSKELEDINKKLDENNEKIKENSDAYTKQKIEIGNYTQSIERAIPGVSQLMAVLTGINEGLIAQTAALKASTAGMGGMAKAAKVLRIALISTGIGAIAVTLGSLISYLTSTQEGIDKVTAVTRPLQAVFQSLIGVVQNLGKFIFDAFSNPKKVIDELMSSASGLATVFQGIVTLDFAKMREGISQVAKDTAAFFEEAAEKGSEIDRLTKEIERSEINIIKFRAETNKQLKEQENIAKNRSLSDAERTAAVKEQERLAKSLVERENEIVDMQIKKLELQQSLNDTSREEEKELQELYATRIKNEERISDIQRRNLGVVNRLQNEIRAAQKTAQQERIKQAEEEAKARLTQMEIELETFKLMNQEKLQSNKETINQAYQDELAILQEKAEQEKWTQSQINLEKLKLKQAYDEQVDAIDAARREQAMLEEMAIEEFEFSQKIERMKLRKESEFAIEREIQMRQFQQRQSDLDTQLKNEEISWGEYTRQVVTLENQRAEAMKQIKEAEKQANINAAVQTIDAVASVVDQASAAGKAISLAKAGFAVYEAISKANAAGFPANIPLIAQASAIGFKAIKDIASVDIPSAKGRGSVGGGGSSSSNARSYQRSASMRTKSNIDTDPTTQRDINRNLNTSDMEDKMIKAVSKGASEGTSKGLVDLSDNKKIQSINTL